MDLAIVRDQGKCPACRHPLPSGELTAQSRCEACGVVFAKYRPGGAASARPPKPKAQAEKGRAPAEKPARDKRIDAYVKAHRKSALAAFVLALFFGPLAMFYVSVPAALLMIVLIFSLAMVMPAAAGVIAVAFWLLSLLAAPAGAHSYNQKKRAEAELLAR